MIRSTILVAALTLSVSTAQAFCGFYVSGADASLYNDATMVVMMRDGTKTVLSMQNNYQGPPSEFALIVPVPVVLQEENVRTLDASIFARVDKLAAPRLVEYWEQDPCAPQPQVYEMAVRSAAGPPTSADAESSDDLGVTIEAQFAVGEYDIVVLSANDSSGLNTWLHQNDYNIPDGAERVLRPYVEQGTKFFVAKVDPQRVTFANGRAVLSPLRVHYDADTFSLPVRLGLLNSQGDQDLLVHILARGSRYEVANYANTTIPTNLRVQDDVRHEFGPFYDALFERIRQRNPRTVVTEYSWDATSCDPCPEPPLQGPEIMTLGADVIGGGAYGFVLTRLHYRYGPSDLSEDLVFREAPAILGGRGMPDHMGQMQEQVAVQQGGMNNFQGRYVILHNWDGPIACESPNKGTWGGPPNGNEPRPVAAQGRLAAPATTAAPQLGIMLAEDVPSLGIEAGVAIVEETSGGGNSTVPPRIEDSGCGGCATTGPQSGAGLVLLVISVWAIRRRA